MNNEKKQEILLTINHMLRDILNQPGLVITESTSADQVDRWDSLAHVNLIMSIERHFRIRFSLGEIKKLRNVSEMIALILVKTENK